MQGNTIQFKLFQQAAILFAQWLTKNNFEFSESLGDVFCNDKGDVHTGEYLFNKFIKDEFVDDNLLTPEDERKILLIVEIDNPAIYDFLIDAGVDVVSTGDHYIFLINKVGYKFPIKHQGDADERSVATKLNQGKPC